LVSIVFGFEDGFQLGEREGFVFSAYEEEEFRQS
jgi:hypothetical protein